MTKMKCSLRERTESECYQERALSNDSSNVRHRNLHAKPYDKEPASSLAWESLQQRVQVHHRQLSVVCARAVLLLLVL